LKKPLAAVLLFAAAVAALAVPAGAAVEKNGPDVPKTKPTFTVPCGKKVAKWWADPNPLTQNGPAHVTHFAGANPCKQWLSYTFSGNFGTFTYYLRPGGHFTWWDDGVTTHKYPTSFPDADPYTKAALGPLPKCVTNSSDPYYLQGAVAIYSYKTPRGLPAC
jgi:hypothetical protein